MLRVRAPVKLIFAAMFIAAGIMVRHHQLYKKMVHGLNYPVPSTESMGLAYGEGANLPPGDTRRLYNRVISSLSNWTIAANTSGAPLPVLASGCSLLRHRAKLYARSRQKWFTGGELLPFFDAFRGFMALQLPHLQQVLDVPYCLAQHPDYPCPSIMTLLARHQGNYSRVLQSCFRSNKRVNWALDSNDVGEHRHAVVGGVELPVETPDVGVIPEETKGGEKGDDEL